MRQHMSSGGHKPYAGLLRGSPYNVCAVARWPYVSARNTEVEPRFQCFYCGAPLWLQCHVRTGVLTEVSKVWERHVLALHPDGDVVAADDVALPGQPP